MVEIYESLELVKDTGRDNIWILDKGNGDVPCNIHYDEVVAQSFEPLQSKVNAILPEIDRWHRDELNKKWDWDYLVFVRSMDSLIVNYAGCDGYVVPLGRIIEMESSDKEPSEPSAEKDATNTEAESQSTGNL